MKANEAYFPMPGHVIFKICGQQSASAPLSQYSLSNGEVSVDASLNPDINALLSLNSIEGELIVPLLPADIDYLEKEKAVDFSNCHSNLPLKSESCWPMLCIEAKLLSPKICTEHNKRIVKMKLGNRLNSTLKRKKDDLDVSVDSEHVESWLAWRTKTYEDAQNTLYQD
tara:strand:+ start:6246 stop:6752 length:507 start_codon:yes stop_codon:yes gene_type:complete